MPQLDLHTYAAQLFWLSIFFVLVFVFLRFFGAPRVLAIIEERRGRIGSDLSAAEAARAEAASAQQAYEATMAEARGKARRLVAETHERASATLTEQIRAATAAADAKVGAAVAQIDAAREAAMLRIRDVACDLASDITLKLANHAPPADSVARAVDLAASRDAA
jgi:F-type H+-transporting ATPase subunit b